MIHLSLTHKHTPRYTQSYREGGQQEGSCLFLLRKAMMKDDNQLKIVLEEKEM